MKKYLIPLSFLCFAATFISAQNGPDWRLKVAPSLLEKTRSGETAPFLVLLSRQADMSQAYNLDTKNEKATFVFQHLRAFADETQKNIIGFLQHAGAPVENLFIVNAIKTEGDISLIEAIAQRPDVARVLDNPAIHVPDPVEWTKDESTHSRSAVEWGLDRINADDVWAMGFRGQGVTVGGEDTGYDFRHPALLHQYRGFNPQDSTVDHNFNWHDAIHSISPLSADTFNPCGLNVLEPCDDYGHGTHTMGTMIGSDGDNQVGVAPDAKWCACRNMERGNGSPFTYLECFQWFLAPTDLNNENPDPALAPHVINNSWGCPLSEGCDSTNWSIMSIAIDNLNAAGTLVVVSAGNDGSGCSSVATPAAMYPGSFSVGATAFNDTIAGFSSRGPVISDGSGRMKPNVSAPGVGVRSTGPNGTYFYASGTSMAGPHV
ncbi:MAG TPA: S8 family serine peptidase, partial [Saprospiraceae bacterium]|nr:S8 family serine peptidase [Saprospiraceae bacterium]